MVSLFLMLGFLILWLRDHLLLYSCYCYGHKIKPRHQIYFGRDGLCRIRQYQLYHFVPNHQALSHSGQESQTLGQTKVDEFRLSAKSSVNW
jgi:hypothetical protein